MALITYGVGSWRLSEKWSLDFLMPGTGLIICWLGLLFDASLFCVNIQ
jgi:hypothetical protein